jgi:hypothetical protein
MIIDDLSAIGTATLNGAYGPEAEIKPEATTGTRLDQAAQPAYPTPWDTFPQRKARI